MIIAARRLEELKRVQSECSDPSKVQILLMDLADPDSCLETTTDLFKKEKVDILVNNGGVSQREKFEDMQFDVCKRMMNINCTSHIAVINAVLPGMKSRKSGKIVNVLSIAGQVGVPLRTMYCSSKFALSGFGKALRPEVKSHGI